MKTRLALWKQIALSIALVAVLGVAWESKDRAFALLGLKGEEATQGANQGGRPPGVPVIVDEVTVGADNVDIWAVGTGRALRSLTLYPEASGQIVEVLVSAGDVVAAGDAILRLDDREAQRTLAQAEAELLEAERSLARLEELLEDGLSTEAAVDTARTSEMSARFDVERARDALDDRTVVAPFDGHVGIPLVDIGDRINESTAIVSLDDRSALIVEFEVAEAYVPRIEEEMAVDAMTPGYADRVFEGTISSLDSRVDPTVRTVLIRAELPNADDALRPGMSFAVNLNLPGESYPVVPELALQWNRDGGYVWRVREGVAELVPATTVRRHEGSVLVDAAIEPGDLIVVEGVQRLRDNRPVTFVEPSSPGDS